MNRLSTLQLYALTVFVWGTTWHAIVYQIAQSTPEFGVTVRFALAGASVLALAAWRGDKLWLPWRAHAPLLVQGLFMYTLSYFCLYHAERHVPSGLVAVGYSASPLLAGLGAWLMWRTAVSARFIVGGLVGLAGVALLFWPELNTASSRPTARLGLVLTVSAVLLSSVGSLSASRNPQRGLSFWPALGWGLVWGALSSALLVLINDNSGQPLRLPLTLSWWLSLLWLAGAGTVVAFSCFLTLQQRVGPGKASAVGVMTPVLALVVSTLFEGYQPDGYTLGGVLLALAGNVLMLRRDPVPAAG